MELTSPAFASNGTMPTRYTCDGANISPPLEWRNVPAKAGALELVMIEIGKAGPQTRWVVGNIDPRSRGVAEGKIPQGAVVGANSEGRASYGGICPAKGKAASIQFELDALSGKIPLSSGFSPAAGEQERKLMLSCPAKAAPGSCKAGVAVLIAVYKRP